MVSDLRIGLTMREVNATGYDEPRDALARSWGKFLQTALPEAAWLPIPNLGTSVSGFCDRWGLNALILTGGEDIGVSTQRDATERALWRRFVGRDQPVFGVCRGLQMIWTELGGEVAVRGGHAAVRHRIRYLPDSSLRSEASTEEVNSFHGLSLVEPARAMREQVAVFARADDGSAEGVQLVNTRAAGVMWHPEREETPSPADIALIRGLFGLG
ncbi:MAG: glutamine amidotransferase [Proteobacteria bacterium]|nr:MAG: glutamine amidotransferase [Pseudomonadota bacterium]